MNFKMNMITSTLLAAGFSLLAGSAAAQTCVANNCAALGFTKSASNCEGDIIRCPFDTSKVFCKEKIYVPKPGDILYSDGTISDIVIASKTPVGIVAYVNGSTGFAVSLTEVSKNWSSGYEDVSCLTNSSSSKAMTDMNGKTNTMCLFNYNSNYSYPAAEYCNTFSAVSSGKGSNSWYLPAAGELYSMRFSYDAINLGLQKLSKTQISSNYYWSSSEYTNNHAWYVRPSDGYMYNYTKYRSVRVRCILAL